MKLKIILDQFSEHRIGKENEIHERNQFFPPCMQKGD